jgi:hypothetical protein
MNKLKFTPNDFPGEMVYCAQQASDLANKALERMLSECPVVYGQVKNIDGNLTDKQYWCATQIGNNGETHTARLVNIEELKPKVCEQHTPLYIEGSGFGSSIVLKNNVCSKCGKKLEATWKEVE